MGMRFLIDLGLAFVLKCDNSQSWTTYKTEPHVHYTFSIKLFSVVKAKGK